MIDFPSAQEILLGYFFVGSAIFGTGYVWATCGWLWGLLIPGIVLGILLLLFAFVLLQELRR